MRYEDASHTGAFQGSEPDARNDADAVPAGAHTPATGNVITGEGTQTGPSGSDTAAGAHITSIAGAGGEDSSFAGGKLAVSGEFGRLSIDAEGNYSYQAKEGAPENSRDRFTYTLADNQGNADTATLTIEIGKTPAVIKAGAQQVVVGPDGVVVLPAGVELSDIHIVGRNLVVDLPDGGQMVILDGAVFVPQLVLGGVEVPATNLAALLIGQEIAPGEGGPPQSSGGNFEVPVGPLDPGVPLGDLIPPTEYGYTPPEVKEVFDLIDEEPEIFFQPEDQAPSVAASDTVSELGLPERGDFEPAGTGEIGDGDGSNDSDHSEFTTGVIVYDSPDGVDSITISVGGNELVITGASVGDTINGQWGQLTITSVAPGAIGYEYRLADNTPGNDTHDDFLVTLVDNDGDVATATLTIDIIDDTPTARPDTDFIAAGDYGPVTGNVITDDDAGDHDVSGTDSDTDDGADTVGADDASLTSVTGAGATETTEGGWIVQGQYGVLTIGEDGSYSYTRNPGTPGGVNDVFNYTLTDGDGDPSSTTLTITIEDAHITVGENPDVLTDDDAVPLAGGNAGGPGDNVDADNLTGTLSGSGGDGPLTFDLQTTGAPDGFSYADGPDGSVLVQQVQNGVTVTVLTITLNASTGAYEVTQNAPILHDPTNPGAGEGEEGNFENNASFTINYTVSDQDDDVESGTLTINVDDDTPEVTETTLGGTVDEDGLSGGNPGGQEDAPGSNVTATGDVSELFSSGADQPLTFSLNEDTSDLRDDLTSKGVPVTYDVDGDTLTAMAGDRPVFTFVLNPETGEYTFTLLDQLDHPSLDGEDGDDTENPTDQDLTIALGSIIQATDADGDTVTAPGNGLVITVDDDSPLPFLDCPDDVIAVNDAGSSFTGDLNLPPVGADEPGTVAFEVEDGTPVLDTEGHPVSSNGVPLVYFVNEDGVLEAHAGDENGDVIFTITINGDGTFTYDQIGDITSTTTLDISNLESIGGGNVDAKAIDVPDSPFDLILSTQDGNSVNTSENFMGVGGGQSLSGDDHIRIDLVQNAFVTGSGGSAVLNFGEYYTANAFRQLVGGLNPAQTGDFIVRAIVVNEAGGSDPSDPADGDDTFYGDTNDTFVATTSLNIYAPGSDTPLTAQQLIDAGITVTAVANGWQVTGMPDGYDYEIVSDTAFNAVQVEALDSSDTFKLGGIEITTTVQTDVDMSVPISLTDSDGDSVVCDIDINLGPPTNTPDVTILVDEAALNVIGSDPGSDAETQSGELSDLVTGGVGPYTFAAGVFVGTHGTLTIGADGHYSYTLTSPVDSQPDANDGTNVEAGVEHFTYTATDADGNEFEGNISVNVIDDVPTAVADSDSVSDGGPLVADGNVLTASGGSDANGTDGVADVKGADQPAVVTDVSFGLNTVAAGSPIAGKYGSLTLNADGSYSYTLNPADPDYGDIVALDSGESTTEVFTYTLVDADGDESDTTLTITINGRNDAPTGAAGAAVVSEEGLSGATTGIPDTTPAGDDTNSASDLDGDLNFTDVDGDAVTYTLGEPAGDFFDADGNPIGWVLTDGNHTLTGSSSAGTVITITINGTTGEYDVVLSAGMDHGNDGNIESEFNIVVPVTVSDGTANVGTTITVQVEDDKPDVSGSTESPAPLLEVDDTTLGTNDSASFAAQFNVAFGGDGPLNPLDEAEYALGINAGATGIFDTATGQQVQLRLDGVTGIVHGYVTIAAVQVDVFTVAVDDDGNVTLDQIRAVVHEDAGGNPSDVAETLASANLITLTATAFDADGDSDSHTINIGTTLQFADDHPSIDVAATDNAGNKVLTQDADTIGVGVQDVATSTVAFNGAFQIVSSNTGNDGGAPLNPGPDGNYALSLNAGYSEGSVTTMLSHGVAIRIYIDANGVITGSTATSEGLISDANRIFTISVSNAAGHEGEVTLTQYQQVDHPLQGGLNDAPFADQELLLPNSLVQLTFSATLEDGDGDVASDSATIDLGGNIGFQDHGPVANDDSDALAPGNVGIADGNVLTGVGGTDTFGADGVADNVGADAPGRISSIAFGATTLAISDGGSQVINGQYGQLTIFSNGNYSYDRFDDSPGGVSDIFNYTLTDFDGDTDSATLTINIGINPPVASAATAKVDDDGLANANPAGTDDINANDGSETGAGIGNEKIYTGSLAASVSGGDGDVDFRLVEPADGASIGQETVNYSLVEVAGVQTLTATIATSPDAGRVSTVLFTVVLDKESGAYTVDLKDNVLHGDDANNNEDGIEVTAAVGFIATDAGSTDSNQATLTIQFNDDVPTANADTATQPTENSAFTIDALANDVFGADGVDINSATKVVITSNATQGTVTYDTSTHLFTYTPTNSDSASSGTSDSFTYKIIDADGDESSATVNITLKPDSTPQVVNVVAAVDDDGLLGSPQGVLEAGNGDINANTGEPGATASEAVYTGQVTVNFGGDTGTVDFSNLEGTFGQVGTERVVYHWNAGTHILTATVTPFLADGTTAQARGNTDLFQVNLSSSGAYTVTLLDNVLHASGGNNENSAPVVDLNYRAIETGGFDAVTTGKLSITFNDDMPRAVSAAAITSGLENGGGDSATANLDGGAGGNSIVSDNFGADGGKVIFTAASQSYLEGLDLKHGGVELTYVISNGGQTMTGSVGGNPIITIELQPGGGNNYTVTMNDSIDTLVTTIFDDVSFDFVGGNGSWAGFTSGTDGDDINDLLLTPMVNGAYASTMNTNANEGGVGSGNSVAFGEGVRIDSVSDLHSVPSPTPSGDYGTLANRNHEFGQHENVIGLSGLLSTVNGAKGSTVDVNLIARDETPGTDVNDQVGDGAINEITIVTITHGGITGTVLKSGGASQDVTVDGITYHVNFGATDATVLDAVVDTRIGAQVADGGYDSLEFRNVTSPDNTFKIGAFAALSTTAGPVDLAVPISVTDGDGDVVASGNLAIHISGSDEAPLLAQQSSFAAPADDDTSSFSSLLAADTQQVEKTAANSNTTLLAAAVAASGFVGTQAAAAPGNSDFGHQQQMADASNFASKVASLKVDSGDEGRSILSNEAKVAANDEVQTLSSHGNTEAAQSVHGLDNAAAHMPAQLSAFFAATDQGPAANAAAAGPVAPAVAMVSAEALQAAGLDGSAKHGGEVDKVLADALGHGGPPTVDGLLQALGGQAGSQFAAISHVASPAADAVPAWDMGGHGAFVPGADMMFKMGAEMLHHDAVQPVANG